MLALFARRHKNAGKERSELTDFSSTPLTGSLEGITHSRFRTRPNMATSTCTRFVQVASLLLARSERRFIHLHAICGDSLKTVIRDTRSSHDSGTRWILCRGFRARPSANYVFSISQSSLLRPRTRLDLFDQFEQPEQVKGFCATASHAVRSVPIARLDCRDRG